MISSPRGAQQPFWLIERDKAVASVILFSGGKGILKIDADGIGKKNNFLVRSRDMFAEYGFNVAIIDVPRDKENLLWFRTTADHAQDVQAVIDFLRQKYKKPVWLIGTSRGTLSAANAAARLHKPNGPDGLVLTASVVSGNYRQTLYDVELDAIKAPTLFVHNRSDECIACPFELVDDVMDEVSNSTEKSLQVVEGGRSERNNPCKALTPYGFLGLEDKVVKDLVGWIKPRL